MRKIRSVKRALKLSNFLVGIRQLFLETLIGAHELLENRVLIKLTPPDSIIPSNLDLPIFLLQHHLELSKLPLKLVSLHLEVFDLLHEFVIDAGGVKISHPSEGLVLLFEVVDLLEVASQHIVGAGVAERVILVLGGVHFDAVDLLFGLFELHFEESGTGLALIGVHQLVLELHVLLS